MRPNLSTPRRRPVVLIASLGLFVTGCGLGTNSTVPTNGKIAPPASDVPGVYTGTGNDPNTPPVAGTPGK